MYNIDPLVYLFATLCISLLFRRLILEYFDYKRAKIKEFKKVGMPTHSNPPPPPEKKREIEGMSIKELEEEETRLVSLLDSRDIIAQYPGLWRTYYNRLRLVWERKTRLIDQIRQIDTKNKTKK